MARVFILLGFLLLLQNQSISKTNGHCCTKQHQLFYFLVGDWIGFDTLGNQIGENTITKLEDNCILSEHWRSSGRSTGRSYNYFNAADSTWNLL